MVASAYEQAEESRGVTRSPACASIGGRVAYVSMASASTPRAIGRDDDNSHVRLEEYFSRLYSQFDCIICGKSFRLDLKNTDEQRAALHQDWQDRCI